jgi:GntR family galactonate operon transcriptional repressor
MTLNPALADPQSHHLNRPTRLVPAVVEALVDRISRGEFAPGDLIPKESELTEQYGVSRTVIREALRVLEEKGLVSVQQGRGTLITERENWDLLDALVMSAQVRHDASFKTLDDLVRVRAAMESDLILAATPLFTDAGRAELLEAFRVLESQIGDPEGYIAADRRFHDVILRTAHNEFGRQIVRSVHEWSISYPGELPPETIHSSHREHTAIRDLVLAGDAEAASKAMHDHIIGSWAINRELILRVRAEHEGQALEDQNSRTA